MASTLLGAVQNPKFSSGVSVNPANNTTKELVKLKGPGLFISADMSKQGGNNDITFVELLIDGRHVVSVSVAALFNQGLTSDNSYGVHAFRSAIGLETVTIGFPVPLTYNKELVLRAVVRETGIVQLVGNVVHTEEPTAPLVFERPKKAPSKKAKK